MDSGTALKNSDIGLGCYPDVEEALREGVESIDEYGGDYVQLLFEMAPLAFNSRRGRSAETPKPIISELHLSFDP